MSELLNATEKLGDHIINRNKALLSEDVVNHPKHYTQYPVEVIEITENLNFCKGNAVKYILRAEFKGNEIQDLEKAIWYLKREIERISE